MTNTEFKPCGYEYITGLIREAIEDESRTAVVTGIWEISEAVRLPSNFTLILQDCHLRLADGCYSNFFVNEHHDTDIGKTTDGTDRNISVIGKGEAILDGGEPNGLHEKVPPEQRPAPIWKNNMILFTNVDGFKVSNISCRNQRWWALNFVYCSNGYIGDIDFCANDSAIDEDGNVLQTYNYMELAEEEGDIVTITLPSSNKKMAIQYYAIDVAGNDITTMPDEAVATSFMITTNAWIRYINNRNAVAGTVCAAVVIVAASGAGVFFRRRRKA